VIIEVARGALTQLRVPDNGQRARLVDAVLELVHPAASSSD
jgi:hypothetical protein